MSRSDQSISLFSWILPHIHSNFSLTAGSLTQLLKKNAEFIWFEKEPDAFNHLKSSLCSTPVLDFPNFEKEFTLCTEASGYGIGAILMQKDDNDKYRVKAYASRLLNKAEQNYDVTTRESLSLLFGPYVIFANSLSGTRYTS